MKRKMLLSASLLSLIAGGAWAADQPGHESPAPGTANEAVSAVEDAVGGAVGVISAEMTTTTKGFITAAAISDMYEVEASRVALERSKSSAIRNFAQEMVSAHTKTTEELKSIISTHKINITLPTAVDDRRQGMLDNLRGADADDFDVRYLNQQTAAHREALILLRGYAKDGDNAALKAFAKKTHPAVEKHLEMAEMLDKADVDNKAN